MKTKSIFWVFFLLVTVILSSCSDVKDYEYVDTVKVETLLEHHHRGQSFYDLVYIKDGTVKTVELASGTDMSFRLKDFRQGDQVLLYKNGNNYYIASEKLTPESIEKENDRMVKTILMGFFLIIILILLMFLVRGR